jgi:hypothetical protein
MSDQPSDRGAEGRAPRQDGRRDPRSRRRSPKGSRSRGGPRNAGAARTTGPIGLIRIDGERFELVHPRCVKETELDFEEGLELWKAGDPESARDALRYALSACHENLWAHVALGRIALDEFHDPALARGHFGYAVELGQRALPDKFAGCLERDRPNNRPFYEALEGLVACSLALGRQGDSASLRALISRLSKRAT